LVESSRTGKEEEEEEENGVLVARLRLGGERIARGTSGGGEGVLFGTVTGDFVISDLETVERENTAKVGSLGLCFNVTVEHLLSRTGKLIAVHRHLPHLSIIRRFDFAAGLILENSSSPPSMLTLGVKYINASSWFS